MIDKKKITHFLIRANKYIITVCHVLFNPEIGTLITIIQSRLTVKSWFSLELE